MAEEKAATFLKGLQIKSVALGGFNKTDTFTKFKELAYIYEEILNKERNEKEQQQEECDKLRISLIEKTDEIDQLKERLRAAESEKTELEKKVTETTNALLQAERNNTSLEAKSLRDRDEIIRQAESKSDEILIDARQETDRMLSSAKAERERIIKSAHDEALRSRADFQREITVLRNEKNTILMEIKVIQSQLADALQTADNADVFVE